MHFFSKDPLHCFHPLFLLLFMSCLPKNIETESQNTLPLENSSSSSPANSSSSSSISSSSSSISSSVGNSSAPSVSDIVSSDLLKPQSLSLQMTTRGATRVYSNASVENGKEIVFASLTLNSHNSSYFAPGVDISSTEVEKSNYLIFNTSIDGYSRRGYGKCLKKGDCPEAENLDLFKLATSYEKVIRNMLIKNVEIKNAFVVENGPHTDLFQTVTYKPDPATFDVGDWLVFQDTILKNSDHNTMIWSGDNFKGLVFQNMFVLPGWLDSQFDSDCQTRVKSYGGPHCYGNQNLSAGSSWKNRSSPQSTWFINSRIATSDIVTVPSQAANTDPNQHSLVVLVGPKSKNLKVKYYYMVNGQWVIADSPTSKVFRYDFIEDALKAHGRPPFLELSCSGWKTPPAGCTTGIGPNL